MVVVVIEASHRWQPSRSPSLAPLVPPGFYVCNNNAQLRNNIGIQGERKRDGRRWLVAGNSLQQGVEHTATTTSSLVRFCSVQWQGSWDLSLSLSLGQLSLSHVFFSLLLSSLSFRQILELVVCLFNQRSHSVSQSARAISTTTTTTTASTTIAWTYSHSDGHFFCFAVVFDGCSVASFARLFFFFFWPLGHCCCCSFAVTCLGCLTVCFACYLAKLKVNFAICCCCWDLFSRLFRLAGYPLRAEQSASEWCAHVSR